MRGIQSLLYLLSSKYNIQIINLLLRTTTNAQRQSVTPPEVAVYVIIWLPKYYVKDVQRTFLSMYFDEKMRVAHDDVLELYVCVTLLLHISLK